MATNHTALDELPTLIHRGVKLLDATRTQRKRVEKLLLKFTKSYFKGDATITEAYEVAADEVLRFHLPFIIGSATPEAIRTLALSVFKEINVDLTALPASVDNVEIVATAVVAWAKYVQGGARSRDAAWRVVGELGDVVGVSDANN